MAKARDAFTLIEVMIAVLIISTVIMALITMSGNNTHLFANFKNQKQINQYASFFISNDKYGLENEDVTLDKLVDEFDLETDLRRKLKTIKVDVNYKVIDTINMNEFDDTEDENNHENNDYAESNDNNKTTNSSLIIEIGKTVLRVEKSSVALVRIQIK